MKARWLINLVLLLVVLVLAMLMRSAIQSARTVSELTDRDPAEVYEVEILRKGEPKIRLRQDPLGWRMEAPMEVDADGEQVAKLLAILQTPVLRSFPKEAADLSELELRPSKITLEVDALTLEFGGIDPLGQYRYVTSDGLVHLISDRFYPLLIAPPIDYVSPKLLPRDFNPVFGRIEGVPLSTEAVTRLNETIAERTEPLAEALSGSSVALKASDGTTLRFVVSEDHRRWARADQHLLYVLTDGPELKTDPTAVDPTPPEPITEQRPPPPMPPGGMMAQPPTAGSMPEPLAIPLGPVPTERVPYSAPVDPNSVVPDNTPLSEPPVFRLTPDGREIPMSSPDRDPSLRLAPEESDNPYGYGVDPFAPAPSGDGPQPPDEAR